MRLTFMTTIFMSMEVKLSRFRWDFFFCLLKQREYFVVMFSNRRGGRITQVWFGPTVINFSFFFFLLSFLDKSCLIPFTYTEKPTILDTTNTSFTLSLPSVTPQQLCPGVLQPTPTYLVFLGQMTKNHRNSSYHMSYLQQKTLVWLFWNKNAHGIIYYRGM